MTRRRRLARDWFGSFKRRAREAHVYVYKQPYTTTTNPERKFTPHHTRVRIIPPSYRQYASCTTQNEHTLRQQYRVQQPPPPSPTPKGTHQQSVVVQYNTRQRALTERRADNGRERCHEKSVGVIQFTVLLLLLIRRHHPISASGHLITEQSRRR